MRALVEPDGHVAEVSDHGFPVHEALRWIEVPPDKGVTAGWTYDGTDFYPPVRSAPARDGRGYGGDVNLRGADKGGASLETVTVPRVSGLQLTANDLHALGVVIAQWAVAEHFIVSQAYSLQSLTTDPELRAVRLDVPFARLRDQWKKLVRSVCKTSPDHLKIGIALAGAAKTFKEDRDAAAHWPGSRDGFQLDEPPRFLSVGLRQGVNKKQKRFTPEDLSALSENIHRFALDILAYGHAIMPDLFPQQTKWVGARPASRLIDTHQFTSIKPQPQTKPTERI
jgi:hypothetical protein